MINQDKKTNRILSTFILITGIVLFIIGTISTFSTKNETKNYVETEAVYSKNDSSKILTYEYIVNNQKFKILTSYETNITPSEGHKRTILYNPANPKEAIFKNEDILNMWQKVGICITLAGITVLTSNPTYLLIDFIAASIFIIKFFIKNGQEISSKTILAWGVSIFLMIIGICGVIKILFAKRNNNEEETEDMKIHITIQDIQHNGLGSIYRILFKDLNKNIYYIFDTKKEDYEIGDRYQLDRKLIGNTVYFEKWKHDVDAIKIDGITDEDFEKEL